MLYRRKMFHTILSGAAQCRKTWSIYQSKKKQTLLLHQLTFHIYIHSFNAMYSHRCQLRHGQNLLSLHFPSQTFYHFPFYTQLLSRFSRLTQDKINSLSLKKYWPIFHTFLSSNNTYCFSIIHSYFPLLLFCVL